MNPRTPDYESGAWTSSAIPPRWAALGSNQPVPANLSTAYQAEGIAAHDVTGDASYNAAMVTPDRGHPAAQQLVLGAFTGLGLVLLLLIVLPPGLVPDWVYYWLVEVPIFALGAIYARVWLWPPHQRRM